ncbi:bifunctional helix-turn-helix transcriptional regulator/GNAT family N-acetyltransferase [Tenacibaculum agarivorans]|uniref:bifunctional helix-turn-helix transcriptional regulator/GNAT family N-acetyltransferase n=1 Tax=Tenacibaculum agarivorans TaxID=1908389 RepID=UPI0009FA1301|nr:bifunctional helix-turn-helix transcriptional regulator/GNAT family N-acetyltransferase [Tenacibaculum agarivorans]
MDALQGIGEIGIGSRLKRLSEYMMKDTQLVYDKLGFDFDPYLFPTIKVIHNKREVTNTEINQSLKTSQPATSQVIQKLDKKGLILLKEHPIDKRKKLITLSEKGIQLIQDIKPLWKSIEHTIKEFTRISSDSLIEHINTLEKKFTEKSFSDAIMEHYTLNHKKQLEIIDFSKEHAIHFYNLNIEWLQTFFYVEPYDEEVLSKPEKYIIDKGGYIFFVKLNEEIVGTVALMPLDEKGTFELTKMAVSPEHRGHKIGQQLITKCIDFAKEQEFGELLLYSNTKLENAIYIYRKYGFVEVPLEENSPYKRSDIKMIYNGGKI